MHKGLVVRELHEYRCINKKVKIVFFMLILLLLLDWKLYDKGSSERCTLNDLAPNACSFSLTTR